MSLPTAWISLSAGAHLTLSHHVLLSPSWQGVSATACADFWQVWEGNRHCSLQVSDMVYGLLSAQLREEKALFLSLSLL